MTYSGTTVLFSFLSRAGEPFWTTFPLLIGAIFALVYPALYALSPRGALIRRKRRLTSFYESDNSGDSLNYLKKKIEAEKFLKKRVPREIGWNTEVILALAYFFTSFGVCCFSCAVLLAMTVKVEKIVFLFLSSLSATFFCGIAVLSYLVIMRCKTAQAIDYIRKIRYSVYNS